MGGIWRDKKDYIDEPGMVETLKNMWEMDAEELHDYLTQKEHNHLHDLLKEKGIYRLSNPLFGQDNNWGNAAQQAFIDKLPERQKRDLKEVRRKSVAAFVDKFLPRAQQKIKNRRASQVQNFWKKYRITSKWKDTAKKLGEQ